MCRVTSFRLIRGRLPALIRGPLEYIRTPMISFDARSEDEENHLLCVGLRLELDVLEQSTRTPYFLPAFEKEWGQVKNNGGTFEKQRGHV
jgi:hypothetical protein